MIKKTTFFLIFIILYGKSNSQDGNIYSKEGRVIFNRKQLINNCLKSLHKDRTDKTALSICECQIGKFDGHFTNKQYKKYTNDHIVDLNGLLKEDSALSADIENCYKKSGQTTLLQAEGFESEFISGCIKSLQKNTKKNLDLKQVEDFCRCQLNLVKEKRISDAEMETINDPNSLLFYEMIYKCGDPFNSDKTSKLDWNQNIARDIVGPLSDTLKILTLNGMTYVKLKIGNLTKIWLLDTGASDMLINKEMEEILKTENIINEANYLGIGEYEMANGMIDTCKKYLVNNIQIGKYSINNLIIAVTDKGKRIIVGKALLNKFSNWILDNTNNTIILTK